jgi:chromosome segregation ATPase
MANGDGRRVEAREPSTQREEPPATWVGDELRRAFETIDQLQREIAQLRASISVQSEQVTTLGDVVQTVEGRTQRHETGQESTRELKQEIVQLEEQLEAEAALRRDLAEHVQRSEGRENDLQMELRRALEVIAHRLDTFEGTQAAVSEQQRRMSDQQAERAHTESTLEGRLDDVEQRVGARGGSGRDQSGETLARVEADVLALRGTFDALEQRLAAMQIDQRRLDEELAQVRSIRDREDQLLDLLEQQRASRAQLETRLSDLEEQLAAQVQRTSDAHEERSLLQREQSGHEERLRSLGERVEAQRLTLIEHLRRELRAAEESGKRQVEEIERELRVARGLILRLSEESAEASSLEEPPL